MEEKRKQFYLTLNELYDRCNEGKDVEGIQQAYDKMSLSLNNMRIDKYCESPIVNAVITSKYEEMKANDIEMKIAIDEIADDIGIERIDLCSVFCNLLDNAIEACQKLDENRFINIRAKKQTGYLTIAVENCYKGKIDKKLIGYKTSKENSNEHGYGTKILALIAERYKGRFYLEESGEMVKAVVLLKL